MASSIKTLGPTEHSGLPDGSPFSFSIVVSSYHNDITGPLLEGAKNTLLKAGVLPDKIQVTVCPGAFELPICSALAHAQLHPDAVIALGCVIKGETRHDEYINHAVANGLMQLSLQHNKPFVFGLLTVENHQQALDRAGGKYGNKGSECAETALRVLSLRFH